MADLRDLLARLVFANNSENLLGTTLAIGRLLIEDAKLADRLTFLPVCANGVEAATAGGVEHSPHLVRATALVLADEADELRSILVLALLDGLGRDPTG